jgi:hypothetical protein
MPAINCIDGRRGKEGTGIIAAGCAEFGRHLQKLVAQLRDRGSSDPRVAEALNQRPFEMLYRTAADATACSVKLTVNPTQRRVLGR